jgi:hypothetical protein
LSGGEPDPAEHATIETRMLLAIDCVSEREFHRS